MQALIGEKKSQTQKFQENGVRIPVSLINVEGNKVIAIKTDEKDHYQAIQLGFGMRKTSNKATLGHIKGAGLTSAPKFLREVRVADGELPSVGDTLNPSEVFQPGDIVNVSGTSKGKGYAGVVKRHNFRGGPKTHGQSDRHRAPGSIGQGTTPGRVYKGKRMAGRMGNENVTVRNLMVVEVDAGNLLLKGLVPGIIDSLVYIEKVGEHKKFVPLYKEPSEVEVSERQESSQEAASTEPEVKEESAGDVSQANASGDAQPTENSSGSDQASLSGNRPTETEENQKNEDESVSGSPEDGSANVSEKEEIKEKEDAKS